MELGGSGEDVVSDEVGQTFTSCTAVSEKLGSNADFWCVELDEDDYGQIFFVALMFLLMALGSILLTYGASLWAMTSLKSITCPTGNPPPQNEQTNPSILSSAISRSSFPQFHWFNDGIATDFALPAYLTMYICIQLLHIAIKLFIVDSHSSHYIANIDDRFEQQDFDYFVNARVIIVIGIFLVNTTIFWSLSIYVICATCLLMADSSRFISLCLMCCWALLSLLDAAFSILVCCVFYPMIITILYLVAVGIFVNITVAVFCCLIQPCLNMLCNQVGHHLIRLNRIRRDANQNTHIQIMPPLFRFLYSLLFAVIFIGFVYLASCLALSYIFAFLDGPSKSVIYVDFNSTNDSVVYALFAATIVIGLIGLVMGLAFSCLRHRELEVENAEFNETLEQMNRTNVNHHDEHTALRRRVNRQRSDPFRDPRLGRRVISQDDDELLRLNDDEHRPGDEFVPL